ncbi:histidine triad nucleotide-binding protein [Buchnera aphidicola]|uniref:Histidine triad nucleotide-binding protein n=1 Tax=Buchnera aphidicola (Aphis gossypii) TaxID=98785 RepID=A0A5J6ZDB6_9GAMM|nr:histidine triad nucleotide-binding protein [Buchnera aphidicola]QFQ32181.1 histidine triad nucleotide-binding protein [Buchnera aphidicola (Aphis gossypii)]UPT14707.1 histidine triad nucleotide-binding protein [Buchnera aphidicola (Aphis gossypii)]
MNNDLIFQKIIKKEISSNILYQDNIVTAFDDINPKAPIHILIVPNCVIKTANEINKKNKNIIAHMFYIAVKIAKKRNISEDGYKIIINCNKNGGQEINYLHMHLLGGTKLKTLY